MSPTLDLSSDAEKILRLLEGACAEAESGWRDGKYGEFKSNYMDNITADIETLQEALAQLEELIQSSEESFPME